MDFDRLKDPESKYFKEILKKSLSEEKLQHFCADFDKLQENAGGTGCGKAVGSEPCCHNPYDRLLDKKKKKKKTESRWRETKATRRELTSRGAREDKNSVWEAVVFANGEGHGRARRTTGATKGRRRATNNEKPVGGQLRQATHFPRTTRNTDPSDLFKRETGLRARI